MTKPAITKRTTKGSPLTYSELDTNFDNLKDATVTLRAGTGGTNVVSDLNGTITLVAGSGISLAGNNTGKTITITNTGGVSYYDYGNVFFSDPLAFGSGTGLSPSSRKNFNADFSLGSIQKLQFDSGYWNMAPPINMTAGRELTLLIWGEGTAQDITFQGSSAVRIAKNSRAHYFEEIYDSRRIEVYPDNFAIVKFFYDGVFWWTTIDTEYAS